jgi:hypothetical protein
MTHTTTKTFLFSLCSVSLALIACKGDKAGTTNQGTAAKSADPAAPAKLVYKPLGGLGLEAQVPDDATINDDSKTAGFPSVTVYAQPTTFVNGAGEDSMSPQTFEAAKKEIQKDPNPFKRFTKEETTADGWKLEYELESMGDKAPIYGYKVRFKVEGKPFECGSNNRSSAERDAVIKLCSSIRKHA